MKIKICSGSKCAFYGASHILESLEELQESMKDMEGIREDFSLDIELIKCPGDCKGDEKIAPLVYIDDERLPLATSPQVMEKVLNEAMRKSG